MAHLTDWEKRIKITVDHTKIDSNLTHFPAPLRLGTSVGIGADDVSCVFDEVGANSKKIAVTKDDGVTQIYVEIGLWDSVAEKAVLWVSKSDLSLSSSTDTVLYLYYDNSKADNTTYVGDVTSTPAKAVWDSNFIAVYHMAQSPVGAASIKDSTTNVKHATSYNMDAANVVDGKIGKALDFDQTDEYLDLFSSYSAAQFGTGNYTQECVFYPDDYVTSGAQIVLRSAYSSSATANGIFLQAGLIELHDRTAAAAIKDVTAAYSAGAWYYAALRRTSGVVTGDINGTNLGTNSGADANLSSHTVTRAATNSGTLGSYFDGKICEIRFSNIARANAWIKATYHACFDTLITWGDEEVTSVEDFSLDLAVQGYQFDFFKMLLEVITVWSITDFKLDLDVKAQLVETFAMLLEVVQYKLDDFAMLLEVTDGTVFDDFTMLLDVVDGTVFDNFKMELSVVSATPAFRSVTAHRVSSVLSEVV